MIKMALCSFKQDFLLAGWQAKTKLLVQKWLVIKTTLFTWGKRLIGPFPAVCFLPGAKTVVLINTSALNSCYYGKQPFRYHKKRFWSAAAVVGKLLVAASSCVLQALPNSLQRLGV